SSFPHTPSACAISSTWVPMAKSFSAPGGKISSGPCPRQPWSAVGQVEVLCESYYFPERVLGKRRARWTAIRIWSVPSGSRGAALVSRGPAAGAYAQSRRGSVGAGGSPRQPGGEGGIATEDLGRCRRGRRHSALSRFPFAQSAGRELSPAPI